MSLQWISLKLISMKLWVKVLKSNTAGILNLSSVPRLCPILSKLGQIFESLLLPEFTMDLPESYVNETMGIAPQSNAAGILNLSSVPWLCPTLSKLGQIFESLLIPEITMDLSETYTNDTMDIDPLTYEAKIGKFVLCSPVCPNRDKLGQIFESLLLPEFTMDLFETYVDESMEIDR